MECIKRQCKTLMRSTKTHLLVDVVEMKLRKQKVLDITTRWKRTKLDYGYKITLTDDLDHDRDQYHRPEVNK